MKYISFVVPTYNAEKYLRKALDSLVIGGEDVEIIVVNDGSKDNSLAIAREYETKYPNIIRVVDKENGGHGSGLNKGIELATGLYYKCVDADDWVDKDAYMKVLSTIKEHHKNNCSPDLYLTNYVFEHLDDGTQRILNTKKNFPLNTLFSWNEVKKFKENEYIMMHMLIYKLSVLKESKVKFPEHTFYVDNIFCYVPLYYVKTMYYIDCDFYRYYVGRTNQSVTFENMAKNYQHQLRVIDAISSIYTYDDLKKLPKKQRKYLIHDFVIISFLTLFYVTISKSETKKQEYRDYFKKFKKENKSLYNKIRFRTSFIFPFMLIPPVRNLAVKIGYKQVIKKTGWN